MHLQNIYRIWIILNEQDALTVNINGPSLPGKKVEGIISYVPGWTLVNSKITYPDLKIKRLFDKY